MVQTRGQKRAITETVEKRPMKRPSQQEDLTVNDYTAEEWSFALQHTMKFMSSDEFRTAPETANLSERLYDLCARRLSNRGDRSLDFIANRCFGSSYGSILLQDAYNSYCLSPSERTEVRERFLELLCENSCN